MLYMGARRRVVSSAARRADDRQNVEDKRGRNDVVEKVAVKISVTGDIADGICLHSARQNEDAGPNALNDEAPRGHVILIQLAHATEEETVARHRIISACPARISPLLQPKVETMIATAMMVAPAPGKITFAVSEATRSLGAF